jgi:uncharacterized protein (TIGR02266 family)
MSEDIAAGGLFVATYKELPLGAHVELTLTLPSDVSVTTTGRIVWAREGSDDMVPGVGVAFEKLEPQAREAIEHFISARPPLFYDL